MYIVEFSDDYSRQADAESYIVRNEPGSKFAYVELYKGKESVFLAPFDVVICVRKIETVTQSAN